MYPVILGCIGAMAGLRKLVMAVETFEKKQRLSRSRGNRFAPQAKRARMDRSGTHANILASEEQPLELLL